MLYGGSLIGRWCVGLLLIAGGLLVAGDGLLRNTRVEPVEERQSTHEAVLTRWRAAR